MSDITRGVYKIMSCINTNQVIDIPGASTNSGTTLQMYESNDTNAQRVLIVPFGNDDSKRFLFMCSGLAMDVKNGDFRRGQTVWQYTVNNQSNAQKWTISQTSQTVKHNGVYLPLYVIYAGGTASGPNDDGTGTDQQQGTSFVLESAGGAFDGAVSSTQVWIWEFHDGDGQHWAIMPDSVLDPSMGTISKLGWFMGDSTSSTGTSHAMPVIPSQTYTTDTVWPAFKGTVGSYQIRYRYRMRRAKQNSWTDFTNWISYATGDTSEDGWADSQEAMIQTSDKTAVVNDNGITRPKDGLTVRLDPEAVTDAYDKAEYEFEVRSFRKAGRFGYADIPFHSNSVSSTIYACFTPTLTIDENNIKFTSKGLSIPYSSNFKRSGNTITIKAPKCGGKTLCVKNVYTFNDLSYKGTIVIPKSEFAINPVDGQAVSFQILITTCDNVTSSKWITKAASRDAMHTVSFSVTENINGYANDLTIVKGDNRDVYTLKSCMLNYIHDGKAYSTLCEETTNGFKVYPPFNTDYSLYITVEKSDGNWGDVTILHGARVSGTGNVFSYDGIDFILNVTDTRYETPTRSVNHISNKYAFEGDNYESTFYASASSSTLQASGIVCNEKVFGIKYGLPTLEDFRALCMQKYVVYRNGLGDRYDVAITSWSEKLFMEDGLIKVTIGMNERAGVRNG